MLELTSTHIRITKQVLSALRLAAGEITTATRRPITSDNETIAALLRHWDQTKLDTYTMRSRPVLPKGADKDPEPDAPVETEE